MTTTQILFDGQKAVAMESLPASAWTWYTPHLTEEDEAKKERVTQAIKAIKPTARISAVPEMEDVDLELD